MPSNRATKFAASVTTGAAILVAVYGSAVAQREAAADGVVAIGNIGNEEQLLSGPQQVAWAGEQLNIARSIQQQVESMLDQARKEKETLKITCLDDKLAQIKVNLRGMEARKDALETAIQSSDSASANQHFMILKIYASRIQGLEAEAESCVGDSDVVLGDAETVVEIDENITVEDPSEEEFELPWVDQPQHASGFY